VDPNHMVDLGAPGGCAGDTTTDYTTIVSGRVDLCDVWHDYEQVSTPLPSRLQQRIEVCQHLNKPSFVGEAGICADITASNGCSGTVTATSLSQRATLFNAKLRAGFNAGLAGYIIWNKGSQSVQNDIGPSDPTERVLAKYTLSWQRIIMAVLEISKQTVFIEEKPLEKHQKNLEKRLDIAEFTDYT
jgi:hypothetical protein